MAYYGQPIIEGLKGLGESIRGYGQTQMQTQLGLGQQQVELAKMEYEAPLKRLQYGTELQKYQLGAARMKELEDQERIDAEPYPFTDIPKHIADPVAKTMRLKMVETEGGRFAQKSDGGFVTRKEMKEGGGQVATVLALTNITDPIAEVKTWTKSDNPELKQEGERLTALGPEGIVREFHNKLLQADVFLEEQGFGKVLDDKIKASQARVVELGKEKTGKDTDFEKMYQQELANRPNLSRLQLKKEIKLTKSSKTDMTPSEKESVIQHYKASYGLPRDQFGKIIARSDPESSKLRLGGWFEARKLEEKRKRLIPEELDGIEQAIMTELELPYEEQHSIRAARMAGASSDELLELLGIKPKTQIIRQKIKR